MIAMMASAIHSPCAPDQPAIEPDICAPAPTAAVARLMPLTAMHITRDAAAAPGPGRWIRRATHQPLRPSVRIMPSANAPASSATAATPWCAIPVAAINAAWVTVSNDSANSTPTPITARREHARSTPSKTWLRQPVNATVAPGAARCQATRLSTPSSTSIAIDDHAPKGSSQRGASHARAVAATASAMASTTPPWPSENQTPVRRASAGRATALQRVIASIAARWSASTPWRMPSVSATASRPNMPWVLVKASIGKTKCRLILR